VKRYFGVIVALLASGAGIVFAMKKWDTKTADAARELSIARLRGDYLERAAWLRNVPEQKAFIDENQNFLRWYFKEVNSHVNKFREADGNFKKAYIEEIDKRAAKGGDDGKAEDKKKRYDAALAYYEMFEKGDYSPWWSTTNKGIRFDILSADTVRDGQGEKIHFPIVIWGLPRDVKVDDKGVRRVNVNFSLKFHWKLTDEKGKLLGEVEGEGLDGKDDNPERAISFFPPGVVFGYLDFDKVPSTVNIEKKDVPVKNVEIEWTITARSPTGGDINNTYKWSAEPPAAWKLKPGEAWQGATESERPDEEINPGGKK
jgi:hypothetical protein